MTWLAIDPIRPPKWTGPRLVHDMDSGIVLARKGRSPGRRPKALQPWGLIEPGRNDPKQPEAFPWKLLATQEGVAP